MSLFGSKRHTFKPTAYGNHRRTRRVPRWLVLMLTGVVLGSGGLLFLQKSYGPARLSVEQSERLHYDLNSANTDKQRLQSQLNQQSRDLQDVSAKLDAQAGQLATFQAELEKSKKDLQLFADAMPADPRGTSPGIRAATFRNDEGRLAYQILVMQSDARASPFRGNVEFVVAGRQSNGRTGSVTLDPFAIELQHYTHLDGSVSLPEGFTPTQVTIKIMAEGSKKLSATRTIRVAR
jgi:hypothetical protein